MDPHATAETRKLTLDGWFINILPDLNQKDPEVCALPDSEYAVVDWAHGDRWHPGGYAALCAAHLLA